MYKITKYCIGALALLLLFFSCDRKNKEAGKIFIQAEHLMEQSPDSTLTLLKSIEFPEDLSPENYANYLLLYIESKDKSGISIAEDTLIHIPVSYFLEKNDIPKIALAYFYSERVNHQQKENKKAMQDFLLAKDYAEKSGDNALLGLIYYDLGVLYEEDFNFKLALNNLQQAHDYFLKAGKEKNAVYVLRLIGNIYLMQEPPQIKLAFDNYKQVLRYAESVKDTGLIVSTLKNIGIAYREIKDYPHAKEYLLQSIAMDKHKEYLTTNYAVLSRIYLSLNLPDSAVYYAEQLSPSVVGYEDEHLFSYYDLMGEIYTYESKYKQVSECYQKKDSLLASFYEQKVKQSVLEVQEKYESVKLKNSLQKIILHEQFISIISLSGALIAILLISFLLVIIRRRRAKIQQMEQNLETMREMYKDYKEDKDSLQHVLLEQLDIAKKIAQLQAIASSATKYDLNETYFKIFGKNMAEKLDWDNLYPVIDKLYDGFVGKLRKIYPDFSEKDIQLCCLLRADFKIDEITFIQDYSNVTTTQALKNKLRMKMGFPGMKELLSFLKNM